MNVNRSGDRKLFHTKKRQETETITDAYNVNDLALLANTPAQAKCLLHRPGADGK